jgi:hypothetical protein
MVVVNVAVLSGMLLANNNPNTFEAITAQDDDMFIPEKRLGVLVPAYQCRYKPSWMWYRGRQKYRWFSRSIQLGSLPSHIGDLGKFDWVRIIFSAWILTVFPCVLAAMTSAETPKVGLGCRALCITIYGISQTILILAYAWHCIRETRGFKISRSTANLLNKITSHALEPLCILGAFLGGIGGTVFQLVGIFRNCACMVDAPGWVTGHGMIQLASDIMESRLKAQTWWKGTGTTAIVLLVLITYIGWSFQKQKRDRFRKLIKSLAYGRMRTEEMRQVQRKNTSTAAVTAIDAEV